MHFHSLRSLLFLLFLSSLTLVAAQDEGGIKPDPLPGEAVVVSEKLKDLAVPSSFFASETVYADQFGPYVLVGRNGDAKESKVLYNLKDGKSVGTLPGKLVLTAPYALSPDGKTFAGTVGPGLATEVSVVDLAKKAQLRTQLKHAKRIDGVQFVKNNQILTVSNFDNLFTLWDATTGKVIKATTVDSFRDGKYAVSPGGKYLAYGKEKQIRFYALETGEKAGELPYPAGTGPFGFGLVALAFSADGQSLAGYFKEANNSYLAVYDLKTLTVKKAVAVTDLKNTFAQDPLIQWSPDGQAILFNCEVALDPQSGRPIWRMPEVKFGSREAGPRMIAANQAVHVVEKERSARVVTSAGVTKDQIAAMVQTAREGGVASDVLLPKLTEADVSAAKQVDLPLGSVAWAYTADALGAASQLTTRPVPVQVKANEIDSLIFTPPETGSVFLELKAPGSTPFGPAPQAAGFEAYSLTTGKKLARADFKFPAKLSSVSADGKRIALVEAEKAGRIDVFTVDKMEPIAGFRPYAKDLTTKIALTSFVGEKLLTVSDKGSLAVWNLPTCKADVVLETPGMTHWKLSPTGKFLAGFDKTSIRLVNAATLQVVGDLPLASPDVLRKETKGLAFDPTGKQLVALILLWGRDNQPRWGIYRYDLTTGKMTGDVEFRGSLFVGQPSYPVETAGADHVLVDNSTLIDWTAKAVVWTYRGQGFDTRHGVNRPDGRHWYTASENFTSPTAYIVPATMPDPTMLAYVEKVMTAKDALLKPGMSLAIEANFTGEHAARVKPLAIEAATNTLKAAGIGVNNGRNLVLKLSAAERTTGETIEFRKLFPSFRESAFATTSVPLMEVNCNAELSQAGRVIWQTGNQSQNMRTMGIIRLPKGETDVGKVLRNQMWDTVSGWAGGAVPPRYIVQTPEGILTLPGTSNYLSDGVQPETSKR